MGVDVAGSIPAASVGQAHAQQAAVTMGVVSAIMHL